METNENFNDKDNKNPLYKLIYMIAIGFFIILVMLILLIASMHFHPTLSVNTIKNVKMPPGQVCKPGYIFLCRLI